MITSFAKKIFYDIMELDELSDIIYIDTDSIYYYNNEKLFGKIKNYVDGLFEIEVEEPKSFLFCKKKKYVEFGDMKNIKMKGLEYNNFYKDKDVKNLSYGLYCNDGGDLNYKCFNRDTLIRREYFIKAKIIINRNKKLNRILYK